MTLDYIAGFFDGEGTVWVRTYPSGYRGANLSFYNTHRVTLEAIRAVLGVGVLRARSGMGDRAHMSRFGTKPQWQLAIQGSKQARRVLAMLQALLITKRDAVASALRDTQPDYERICVVCGGRFESIRGDAIYCRKACNQTAYARRQLAKGFRRGHREPWTSV